MHVCGGRVRLCPSTSSDSLMIRRTFVAHVRDDVSLDQSPRMVLCFMTLADANVAWVLGTSTSGS